MLRSSDVESGAETQEKSATRPRTLVNYSDSSEEAEKTVPESSAEGAALQRVGVATTDSQKKAGLLALRKELSLGEEVQLREKDEQQLGRIRKVAHQEGVFSSFVYFDAQCIRPALDRIRRPLAEQLTGLRIPFLEVQHYHLSLSRNLYLHQHQLDDFVRRVSDSLRRQRDNYSVAVQPENLVVLDDERQQRSFVALRVYSARVEGLIDRLDAELRALALPVYYANKKLHISLLELSTSSVAKLDLRRDTGAKPAYLPLKEATIKVGQRIHSVSVSI